MIIGSIMLIFIHFTFSIPMLDNWLVALILILLLGIAFSLVPSAMWLPFQRSSRKTNWEQPMR